MARAERTTVAERLFWCYANLAMAEMAVHEGRTSYGRKNFMVRAVYKGLTTGAMTPGASHFI